MDIELCYRILQIGESSSDDEISRSYKAMAMKYHPDKNPQRREWANEQMTVLNTAYSTLMSYRFSQGSPEAATEIRKNEQEQRKKTVHSGETPGGEPRSRASGEEEREYLISRFVRAREDAKDVMYKYFQYNLYNFHRREERGNRKIYNDIIVSLRKSYHLIKKYSSLTGDNELIEHFNIFNRMIFDFYRASECLNIIDSYNDSYEVDAYRMYRKGDEHLHRGEKELFFDRHNRGHFDMRKTVPELLDAENIFRRTLQVYKNSSWAVESSIKLEYVLSLKAYITLFFSSY